MKTKSIILGLIVGLGLLAGTGVQSQAKTVNYGSLTPTQRARSYMKLSVGKQDHRYPAHDVMLPVSVKLKNTTDQAYRYYFTQLYAESHNGSEVQLYRLRGLHKHVTVKAHSTKTVRKAFYENDQTLVGWVNPGTADYTYLKYASTAVIMSPILI